MGVSSVEQLQWEVSLWEEVFPRAVDPQDELDEDFWLNLLEPEEEVQEEVQLFAIMDAPDQEAPTDDRPDPHAGVRIGEASNPGPPAAVLTTKHRASKHGRRFHQTAGKPNRKKEKAGLNWRIGHLI
eukprot:13316923-Heterocapsa_arctica.AAC.1